MDFSGVDRSRIARRRVSRRAHRFGRLQAIGYIAWRFPIMRDQILDLLALLMIGAGVQATRSRQREPWPLVRRAVGCWVARGELHRSSPFG
jgi:hypothetical protein